MSSTSGATSNIAPTAAANAEKVKTQATMARVMTLPPESVFEKVAELAAIEDEDLFYSEAVSFVVLLTGARIGMLCQRNNKGGAEAKLIANATDQNLSPEAMEEVNGAVGFALNGMRAHRQTVQTDHGKLAVLCAPFRPDVGDDGGAQAQSLSLVLLLGPERAPYLEPIFSLLQMTVANLMQHGHRLQLEQLKRGFLQATLLIDLFTKASTAHEYKEACSIVVSELQDWIGCDRTAVGSGKNSKFQVDAISGLAEVQKRTHGTARLISLFKETSVIDSPIAWPPPQETGNTKVMAASDQSELLSMFSSEQVLSVPLANDDENDPSTAALSFFWREKQALDADRLALIEAAVPHVSALFSLLKKALPSGVFGKVRHFKRTASKWKKVSLILMPVIFLVVMFIPVPHRVAASARITPAESRQVAAPISGVLEETFVKPGETVEANAVIAKLDGKEIGWRLAEAIANREVAGRRRDQARAAKNVPATQLAQHEYDALALEAELLKYRQDHLEIHAPISGLVLSGDLQRSRGVPVETGQKLFEIASLDRLKIELAVNDEDIRHVNDNMNVAVRLQSRSGSVVEATIDEIYPVSEVKDGGNVFVCLASIDNTEGDLRPGMRGRARISSDWKSLGWVLFHKPWEWMRLKFL